MDKENAKMLLQILPKANVSLDMASLTRALQLVQWLEKLAEGEIQTVEVTPTSNAA